MKELKEWKLKIEKFKLNDALANKNYFQEFYDYKNSMANPEVAAAKYDDQGKFLSVFYAMFYHYPRWLVVDTKRAKLFENCIKDLEKGMDISKVVPLCQQEINLLATSTNVSRYLDYSNSENLVNDILQDKDVLHSYGFPVRDTEIKMANFLKNYDLNKIKKMADVFVSAFWRSFVLENKSTMGKDIVNLRYNIGTEVLVKEIIATFKKKSVMVTLSPSPMDHFSDQMFYDHRFDDGLYLNTDTCSKRLEMIETAFKNNSNRSRFLGVLLLESFGQASFFPENKKSALRYTDEQRAIYQEFSLNSQRLSENYLPSKDSSFSIMALPSHEIGHDFNSIFEKITEMNSIDSSSFEKIQQGIIEVLDKGVAVEVKGKNGNLTNITVTMHGLNSEKETLFENCGATVNIPVGEVFTSPLLKGTTGVLHVKNSFLEDLNYKELYLRFEDGWVVEYDCKNFDNLDQNQKYIKDNLLFPHPTLPLGEFAIGTNTLAYQMANQYNILDRLPILIVEKMGPHFALGDTCYSFVEEEETKDYLTGKKIIAKFNEFSSGKYTHPAFTTGGTSQHLVVGEGVTPDNATNYTSRHVDITLPFNELEYIRVKDHKDDYHYIIQDGKFVIPGTSFLNKYL